MQLSPYLRALGQLDAQKRAGSVDDSGVQDAVRSGSRQMTEREAWVCLGKLWERALFAYSGTKSYSVKLGPNRIISYGLCVTIDDMKLLGWISRHVQYLMKDKIKDEFARTHCNRLYLWGWDEASRDERVKFCKTQAEKCMLTEKEAWLVIAEDWSRAKENILHWYSGKAMAGLCPSIGQLFSSERITKSTWGSMIDKIENYREQLNTSTCFLWPRDQEGAKARVEFCRLQAEKL
jgi:hypothetical protein